MPVAQSAGTAQHPKCFTPSHVWLQEQSIFSSHESAPAASRNRSKFVFHWHCMDNQARKVDAATRDTLQQFVQKITLSEAALPATAVQRFNTACKRLPDAV